MNLRLRLAAVLIAVAALAVWRSQLFVVSRPGERPRALVLVAPEARTMAGLDLALPAVPIGIHHLRAGDGVLVIHYWAPWERHAALQAAALDSLSHRERFANVRVVVVCFDPFPSVSRYVARQRLRLAVLLDGQGALRQVLPCPSIPFTYVLDSSGRIAAAQPGEMDWLSPETGTALDQLLAEPRAPTPPREAPQTGA